jgi:CheY-like chemotaxis protein
MTPHHARVLVVDDDRDNADSLALLLGMHGHRVRVAYDGRSALQALDAGPADVVLLDLAMPDLTGLELARQVRQRPGMGHALLVCVSGYDREAHVERARQAGCDHYLIKPVDPADLLRLVAGHRPPGWTQPGPPSGA